MGNHRNYRVEGNYDRDGAVCVRGALSPEAIGSVAYAIDAVIAQPSLRHLRASDADDGAFVEDFCNHRRVPALGSVIDMPIWGELAATLTNSAEVRFFHDHVLVREAGTSQRTPWHQDQPYYNVDGTKGISFWIPTGPVPLSESLELVAGSHKGPWYVPRTFKDHQAKWFPPGALAEAPDFSQSTHQILRWQLEPGDLVAFNMATVHGAPGTGRDRGRKVLSLRYLGDDMRHAPRPWTTSPPFPGLEAEIEPGQPMDHPLFPVVWPSST